MNISNISEAIGILTFLLAIIDVGIGFNLSLSPSYNKKWTPLIIAVVIFCIIIYTIRWFTRMNKKDDAVDAENDVALQRLKYAQAERVYTEYNSPPGYEAQQPQQYPVQTFGVPKAGAWDTHGSGTGGVEVGKGETLYQTVAIPERFHS
jgi:hypothetical protein